MIAAAALYIFRTESLPLWAQAVVYFTTACLMYRRHIIKMVIMWK